jgi:hypothetical protein
MTLCPPGLSAAHVIARGAIVAYWAPLFAYWLRGWCLMVGGPVRGDRGPVWQQLTSVFKDHDPVAEQRPALLRVAHNRVRGLAIWCRRVRTGR